MFVPASMVASAIVEAAVRGSIALLVAAPIAFLLRRRASAQSFAWHVAFAGVLSLTIVSPLVPSWVPPVPNVVRSVERITVTVTPAWLSNRNSEPTRVDLTSRAATRAGAGREPSSSPIRGADVAIVVFALVWLLGAAWRAARGVLEILWLRQVERGAHDVSSELPVDTAARRVTVVETSAVVVPMVWGLWQPRLLLPNGWRHWPASVVDAVVRHEVAHLERHDLLAKICVELVVSILWFNPIVWIAARRAHLARERACDDRALRLDLAPEDYAAALVELARHVRDSAKRPRLALAVGKSSELAARVQALLDPSRSRATLGRATALTGALGGAIMLAPVAVVHFGVPNVAFAGSAAAPSVAPREAVVGAFGRALDSAFASFERSGFSGVILVARDNGVVFRRAYGFADRARNTPMTVGTPFQVAGVMKAVTAAAVIDLVDRGLVALDTPVGRYLPELRGPVGEVTLRQLLLHTDGVSNVRQVTRDRSAFLREVAATPPAFPSGSSYSSTDAGHSVLAAVVEQVVGRPFDDVVRDGVIRRARLSSTSVGANAVSQAAGTAVGYVDGRDARVPRPEDYEWGVRGSRGLLTTADDLHRWYLALAAAHVVSPQSTQLLFTSHLITSKRFGQGFGWLLYDSTSATAARSTPIPGRRRSGREAGFEAELVHNPGGGWIAVILANTDDNALRARALETVGAVMGRPRSE